jgi:hypothetical protein
MRKPWGMVETTFERGKRPLKYSINKAKCPFFAPKEHVLKYFV